MKQLLILSGKGGTGKTTIAGTFIKLSKCNSFADCDVDAPNLHMIMNFDTQPKCSDYYEMPKAVIDNDLCLSCGKCKDLCRFDAVSSTPSYHIVPYSCEGCGLCVEMCPNKAISLAPSVGGELNLYTDDNRAFSSAILKMGGGTSGKLVTEVKKQLRESGISGDLSIIDGSPGIGCPIIASISGADMVLIVAEPSVSGISDMERILKCAETFNTPCAVCINKYDINEELSEKIIEFCKDNSIDFVGTIPFDKSVIKAVNEGMCIADIPCEAFNAVKTVFDKTMKIMYKKNPILKI